MSGEGTELTPEEEQLIIELNNRGVREINFQLKKDGSIIYQNLEEHVDNHGIDDFKLMLSSLEEKGYLRKTETRPVIFCPKCNSHNVYSVYTCPKCRSDNVDRLDFLEHLHCGYIDERDKFQQDSKLICPNCDIELKYVELEDSEADKHKYHVVGTNFVCDQCGAKFEKPDITHICQDCEARFNFKNSRYEKLISYQITQKGLDVSPQHAIKGIQKVIQDILESTGLKVTIEGEVSGESLGEHIFDIVARSPKGPDNPEIEPILIVGDISLKGDPQDLITLFGKSMDIAPTSTFYVDMSGDVENNELKEKRNIEAFYGMSENFEVEFRGYLEELIPKKEEKKKRFGIF
jgi:hypothetical protein